MIVNVIGIGKLVEGEYQGRQYANRALYVSYEDKQKCSSGLCVEKFKVSSNVSDLSDVSVGSEVDVVFNRYGRIIEVKGV